MKKIYTAALNMADANVLKENISRLLSFFQNSEEQERLVEILLNMDTKDDELPKKVKRDNDVILTLVSTDYLNDSIRYAYMTSDVYYFKTEEDAKVYVETGKRQGDYSWSKKEEYPFTGKRVYETSSTMSYKNWLSYTPVEE